MVARALSHAAGSGIGEAQKPQLGRLIRGAAVLTLLVTLLRLFGELQGWSERFFSRAPGGPWSLVGIVWLVPVFGLFFGWKLAQLEYRPPSALRAVGICLLALAVVVVAIVCLRLLHPGPVGQVLTISGAGVVAALIGLRAWPELGSVMLTYGLMARVPVVVVYLLAFLRNWGTHYDAVPPGWPAMSVWWKFVTLGLVPQLTIWIAFTIVVGTLFGLPGAVLLRKNTELEVAHQILDAVERSRKKVRT